MALHPQAAFLMSGFANFVAAQNYTTMQSSPSLATSMVGAGHGLEWTQVFVVPQDVFFGELNAVTNVTFVITIMILFTVNFSVDLLLKKLRRLVNDSNARLFFEFRFLPRPAG